jgi:hypothetical protein
MKILGCFFIVVCLLTISACHNKVVRSSNKLFKQYSLCRCLDYAKQTQKQQKDTNDFSMTFLYESIDGEYTYAKIVTKSLDSFALNYTRQLKLVSSHVDTNYTYAKPGMHQFTYDCIRFYESRALDSLIRSFKKEDYIISAADKKYK